MCFTDTDECSETNHSCHEFASCTNTPAGGYTCTCMEGYTGNGTSCSITNPRHLQMGVGLRLVVEDKPTDYSSTRPSTTPLMIALAAITTASVTILTVMIIVCLCLMRKRKRYIFWSILELLCQLNFLFTISDNFPVCRKQRSQICYGPKTVWNGSVGAIMHSIKSVLLNVAHY